MFFFLFIDACSGIRDNYFGILFQGIGQCIIFSRTDGNIYVSFFRSKLEGIRQNIQDNFIKITSVYPYIQFPECTMNM